MRIVPALDELEDCELRLGMRAECCAIDEFTFRTRRLPAFEIPCSMSLAPLCEGVGVSLELPRFRGRLMS